MTREVRPGFSGRGSTVPREPLSFINDVVNYWKVNQWNILEDPDVYNCRKNLRSESAVSRNVSLSTFPYIPLIHTVIFKKRFSCYQLPIRLEHLLQFITTIILFLLNQKFRSFYHEYPKTLIVSSKFSNKTVDNRHSGNPCIKVERHGIKRVNILLLLLLSWIQYLNDKLNIFYSKDYDSYHREFLIYELIESNNNTITITVIVIKTIRYQR